MSVLFIDGFDKYGPTGEVLPTAASLLTAGEWTSLTGSTGGTVVPAIVAGLSSTGYALQLTHHPTLNSPPMSGWLGKTLATNYSRLIGGVRIASPLNTCFTGVAFLDAANFQCCISLNSSGQILLQSGRWNVGTTVATSGVSISANTSHYLEWDITFGASGAYQIWMDGVSILSGTGNTRGGSANNYANAFVLGGSQSTLSDVVLGSFDDLYLFDTAGSVNNAVLLTSPRIETQLPSSDVQTQFVNGASQIGDAYSATASTNAPGANQIFLRSFTPESNMTLNSVSCIPNATSGTAKLKAVLYASLATGAARVAVGTEVTGTTSGTTLTAPFSAGQALTGGVSYAIGFITDTSVALRQVDAGVLGAKAANTYASGGPATLPAMTAGQPNWEIWGNTTGSTVNWVSENQNPPIGDVSYAYAVSSTVANEDLYGYPALSTTPTNIHTVAVKSFVKKSDAGTRTGNMRVKSGSSSSSGSNTSISLGTNFAWIGSFFDTDPATAIAWTASGVNAAASGASVAS